MNISKLTLGFCLLGAGATPIFAKPYTPAKGSSEREAIMNAMRRVVGPGFRKRVVFVPRKLRVERGWAWFNGHFQFADGTTLYDLKKPELMDQYAGGGFEALLHKERGVWRVKYSAHPTDVDTSYRKRFPAAPRAIFR